MRTKALLLTAAVAAAGIVSPTAQVFSVNAVGYVSQTYQPGFTLIANPLDAEDNSIGAILADAPAGTGIYKWNGQGFDISTRLPDVLGGGWDNPDVTLAPGEGAFINLASEYSVVYVGEVMQGDESELSITVPPGFSVASSMVPISGTADELGLTEDLTPGDALYAWTGQGYMVHTMLPEVLGGGWDELPTINIGQAVFLNVAATRTWDRSFSVNQ